MHSRSVGESGSFHSLPAEGASEKDVLRQRTQEVAKGCLKNVGYLEAAVQEAAKEGHLKVARFLLSKVTSMNQCDLTKAIGLAADSGHAEVVKFLLSRGGTISQKSLEWRVKVAVTKGDVEVLRVLLSGDRTISQEELGWRVKGATAKGDAEVVRTLLDDHRTVSREDFEESVRLAAGNGHVEVMEVLLSHGRMIDQERLAEAVRLAAGNGHAAVVGFLLSNDRMISQYDLAKAVDFAVENGRAAVVKVLLSCGRMISQKYLGLCVKVAVAKGDAEVLRALLSGDRTISQEELGWRVKGATAKGDAEVVRTLLGDHRTVSREDFEESVRLAAGNGHVEVVEVLLSRGRMIDQERLAEAVRLAAGNGHAAVVGFLLSNDRMISQHDLAGVVGLAARNGHVEVVMALLSNDRTLDLFDLGESVGFAAENGHAAVVRVLLSNNRAITPKYLGWLVGLAVGKGATAIVEALLNNNRPMIERDLSLAVLSASSRGHLACVELLIRRGSITQSARASAITNASGRDRRTIQAILENARTVSDQAVARPRGQGVLNVKFSEIKKNPQMYLNLLLAEGLSVNINVTQEDGQASPAIDLGGVKKQLVTSVCAELGGLLHCNSENIPAKLHEESIHRQLGHLFSLVYDVNRNRMDPILTGRVVNERFLEMVRVAADVDNKEGLKAVCKIMGEVEPLLIPSVNFVLEPTLENANEYLKSLLASPLSEGDKEKVQEVVEEAEQIFEPFYLAAKEFLEGTTEEFKRAIMSMDIQELDRSIQGAPLAVLDVLRSLRFAPLEDTPEFEEDLFEPAEALSLRSRQIIAILTSQNQEDIEGLREELLQEQQEEVTSASFADKAYWLVATIASKDLSQEADRIWLDKFFFAITGQKTMSAGTTIRVQQTWREGAVFEIHTCFNGLDLPDIALSRAAFSSTLDFAINLTDYNIA